MKSKLPLFILSFFFLFSACGKTADPVNPIDKKLSGHWINPTYNADYSVITFTRESDFDEIKYGVAFKENRVFIERKNGTGCGTPPITYKDFEGNWSSTDSTLSISVDNWNGTSDYQWRVISLDHQYLSIEVLDTKHHWQD